LVAAGVTWFLPEEGDFKYKDQLENELAIAFGGRVAEEIIFNRISTGASNDIKQATSLANRMVRTFGMSDNLAPLAYETQDDNIFIGREMTQAKDYSEDTARKIDTEIALIIDRAYKTAKKVLDENIDILHALTDLLIEKETVLGPELDDLIASVRPDFDFFGKKNIFVAPKPVEDADTPADDPADDQKEKSESEDFEIADDDEPEEQNETNDTEDKESK